MKLTIAIIFAGVFVVALSFPSETEYTDVSVNVEEILANKRLLRNYLNCLLDKGKCSPEAQDLKRVLPDALKSNCAKCTDQHKEVGRRVLSFLIEKEPEMYKELEAKYDPSGEYRLKYKDEIKA